MHRSRPWTQATYPSREVHDLDIAIVSDGGKIMEYCRKNLEESGYEILERNREYYLNIIDPVAIMFAKNKKWTLDVAFLGGSLERKINLIPPSPYHTSMDKFDIDSVFWRYPQLEVVDLYKNVVRCSPALTTLTKFGSCVRSKTFPTIIISISEEDTAPRLYDPDISK